ncbi:lysophosphatidic acid receptor 6-like [Thalassophryne amazonica]|uniref:lysophosphatidic acid receptor 6-like n=1 Tax=Thalassophryne amazonica TaxID=390379 RepID=UPI001471DEEB|nr:lysophosphatidic acid receptor 6-like [Thalassophryne amazonica]
MSNITWRENETALGKSNLVYTVVFSCIMVVGLPLNTVSLCTLLCRHSLKSSNVVFLVNLALSDLLLIISLPMRTYFYATGTWPFSVSACISTVMLFRNNIRSSSIFITMISMDRLLAVVYPLRSRHLRTASIAWKSVVVVWLFLLVMNIPESVELWRGLKNSSDVACFGFPRQNWKEAIPYFQPVLVLILLAINIVSTALVSWTIHRHLDSPARGINKVNIMVIFSLNLMMFTIFFLPMTLSILIKNWTPALKPLICLASVNCCLDPLLYYFSLEGFWRKKEDSHAMDS